ncbi:MAG: RHS repeat-associated core domain-containing protein, partial [Halanaerobiales bacterium]
MRIKSTEKILEEETNRTSYYVYSYSGSVLMEESSGSENNNSTEFISYIYAFAKTFAKVDGIVNPALITVEKIAYFHHDNLGSTRLMTDGAGNVVMEQDYMPFGEDLPVVGQTEVLDEEAGGYKYTGQKEVVSIGLYYYGARYYDPSIGRFIT